MKIKDRKKFMFSCIFFTLLMVFIGKVFINFESKGFTIRENKDLSTDLKKVKEEKKEHIIILDAGHGGEDKGSSYKDINEKDLTLNIVKKIQLELASKGYKVILTRKEDELISLKEIGNIVNASKADAFISIHINFFKDSNLKGITTYFYDIDEKTKESRINMAKTIQATITKDKRWEDRGVRKKNLAVLRYSELPCVLIECGYLSNLEDREKLCNEEEINKLSENIAKGVENYYNNSPLYKEIKIVDETNGKNK